MKFSPEFLADSSLPLRMTARRHVRREEATQGVERGLLAQMSVEKVRCALTKCLSGRRIRVSCADVGGVKPRG